MVKKYTIRGIIILAGIIIGFIYLLRSCLAKYDERSAMSNSANAALYFEKGNDKIVFTVVQYQKAVSYKSGGGFTSKSVSTTYYVQANNAISGEKIDIKKVKHHSDVKNYPVTILGKGGGNAWVFIGEPMAFNPFTLEKVADKNSIEEKNPALKGKMPNDKQYYDFNEATESLLITAKDGLKYILSTATLLATPVDEDATNKSPADMRITQLEKETKRLNELNTQAYENFRRLNKLYSEKKLSYAAYADSTKGFDRSRDSNYAMQRRITEELNYIHSQKDDMNDEIRRVENFRNSSKSYSSMCTDADTINGKWYGFLTAAALEKFYNRFQYKSVYEETARNKLYSAAYTAINKGSNSHIEIAVPQKVNDAVYLQGGFLYHSETAKPIHLGDGSFIVCYKETVGYNGNIMLAVVDTAGKAKWNVNTKLSSFTSWIYTGSSLIVFGTDNKELSSGEINVMHIINLQNGSVITYDFFADKVRKP